MPDEPESLMISPRLNRRTLLAAGGGLAAAALLHPAAGLAQNTAVPAIDRGTDMGGKVEFPAIHAETELPGGGPPNPDPRQSRVGFAVIGLGRLALENILPAFGSCKHARVTALVSGDAAKASTIAAQYGIAHTYSYDTLEQMGSNPDVQAVYIVLPNSMHREYTERAAKIGRHVLTEKPMTVSSADAEAMIRACAAANVRLMVAYRCQYERNNRYLQEMVRGGQLGKVLSIHAINVQNDAGTAAGLEQWRYIRALAGGGSLPDVGLYCLNTARAVLGEEPVEIQAGIANPPGDPRFRQVEDVVNFSMRFPSGAIVASTSSYSSHQHREMQVMGSDAWARLANAFDYHGQKLTVSRRSGIAESASELSLNPADQFSLEIDHFAECVRSGREPRTGGREGLQDQKLMEAIYEAARSGRAVQLPPVTGIDATRGPALPPLAVG